MSDSSKFPLYSADPMGDYSPVPTGETAVEVGDVAEPLPIGKTASRKTSTRRRKKRDQTENWTSAVLDSAAFQAVSVMCILANAVCIGFETDMPGSIYWDILENCFLFFFTCELSLRIYVAGLQEFFDCRENGDFCWNFFDAVIVCLGVVSSLVTWVIPASHSREEDHVHHVHKDVTIFRIIRLLRILRIVRVIRVIRFLKQLYLLAYGFLEGAMAVFWVSLLAIACIYVCAVIIVRTYTHLGDEAPQHDFFATHFSSVPITMFTLFEIMASPTIGPYRVLMFDYPAFVYFIILFVIFGSFGINGLLTGVISESIFEKNQARIEESRSEREAKRSKLMEASADLFDDIDCEGTGLLTREELNHFQELIIDLFAQSGVALPSHDFDHMLSLMTYDENGMLDKAQFVHFMLEVCEDIRPMSFMELHTLVSKCNLKIDNCDNKVDFIVKSVDDMAIQRATELQRAEEMMRHCRDLLDRHRRSLSGPGVHGALKECEGIMEEMNEVVNSVTDLAQTAVAEAKGVENLAHHVPARVSAKAKRKGARASRVDPSLFQSAPPRMSVADSERSPIQTPLLPGRPFRRSRPSVAQDPLRLRSSIPILQPLDKSESKEEVALPSFRSDGAFADPSTSSRLAVTPKQSANELKDCIPEGNEMESTPFSTEKTNDFATIDESLKRTDESTPVVACAQTDLHVQKSEAPVDSPSDSGSALVQGARQHVPSLVQEARNHVQSLMQIQSSLLAAGEVSESRVFNELVTTALARIVLDAAQAPRSPDVTRENTNKGGDSDVKVQRIEGFYDLRLSGTDADGKHEAASKDGYMHHSDDSQREQAPARSSDEAYNASVVAGCALASPTTMQLQELNDFQTESLSRKSEQEQLTPAQTFLALSHSLAQKARGTEGEARDETIAGL